MNVQTTYFSEFALPLLQPLIQKEVELVVNAPAVSSLIAQYVVSSSKVDSLKMIELFQKKIKESSLKSEIFFSEIQGLNQKTPGLMHYIFDTFAADTDVPSGSLPLKLSLERRLAAYTRLMFCAFAGEHIYMTKMPHKDINNFIIRNNKEYFDFLDCIVDIDIHTKCDVTKQISCYDYVFGHEKWLTQDLRQNFTKQNREEFLALLRANGYVQTLKAAKGQIILYHNKTTILHCGIIDFVSSTNEITVLSKFGFGHVFRHRAGVISISDGNSVTFLTSPK